jgi:hypothetical protein
MTFSHIQAQLLSCSVIVMPSPPPESYPVASGRPSSERTLAERRTDGSLQSEPKAAVITDFQMLGSRLGELRHQGVATGPPRRADRPTRHG